MRRILLVALFASLSAFCGERDTEIKPLSATTTGDFPHNVSIRVDASKMLGEMRGVWRFFGADEPNYATAKDGKKLLADIGKLRPNDTYFRAHNLLCTGDGTPALKWGSTNIYTENAQGQAIYDFRIVDSIFDSYLERGVHPFAEIGFMPKALSIAPDPYQHSWTPAVSYGQITTGWAYPPTDYDRWRELVYQWAKHSVERYGREEVERWYWEVWNEPNGSSYWRGTAEEFRKLHDYAIDGVRRALPTARVGGPHTAGPGGSFQRDFLEHCLRGTNYATGQTGTPLDFVAFHAKGVPTLLDGHVRMGIAAQLSAIDEGFRIIASYPELKAKPIVLGESDPDGCAACQGDALGYRNTTLYASYTAASFAREYLLADKHRVNLDGVITWAFEFEDQPFFAGFRVLASNGLTLPVFNVFRMFSQMRGQRIAVESSGAVSLDTIIERGVRNAPDVSALASRDDKAAFIMVWSYHDDDLPAAPPFTTVDLTLRNLPIQNGPAKLRHFRIDADHSNAFEMWKRLGSPQAPTADQRAQLETSSELQELEASRSIGVTNGEAALHFDLQRQAVSLIVVEW